jgi:hypothetical protein
VINDRFGITISNKGQRETNALRPHDHQQRKDWFPKWKARFNPKNKLWSEITEADIKAVINDPAFLMEIARYRVMFTGERISEVAEGLPNTLTKQLGRTRELLTWEQEFFRGVRDALKQHNAGEFALMIYLNNRAELKTLGMVTDSNAKLYRALTKHHRATVKARLKALRRKARLNNWTDELLAVKIQDAKERIHADYRLPLEMLRQGEGTAVTYSLKGRGEHDNRPPSVETIKWWEP